MNERAPGTWQSSQYQLIDFGAGRKLERFGEWLLDRPSPAALGSSKNSSSDWRQADVRLSETDANQPGGSRLTPWTVHFELDLPHAPSQALSFQLRVTPFGHVGLFPEQADNWQWLADRCQEFAATTGDSPRALNLFGYTGGSTLALAAAGARVVHVDAASPSVQWARSNAEASGLAQCPIRWIVDDARKFVSREVRRGNGYDIVVLDPPSYGHGPKGKPWKIEEHIAPLLSDISLLLQDSPSPTILFTAHSDSPGAAEILGMLEEGFEFTNRNNGRCALIDTANRRLDAGYWVRCTQ